MSRARLVLTLLLGAVAAALTPSSAHAGWYQVQSCYPDGVAPGWVASDVAHTTAYIDCTSSSTYAGLRARNVIGGGDAPGLAHAQIVLTSPPGTHFDWMRFDGDVTAQLGWHSGLYDFANGRWAWCGPTCETTFGWRQFEIPLSTNNLGVLLICGRSTCATSPRTLGSVGIRNVTLRVQDLVAPTLQLRSGSLLTGRWLRGTHSLTVASSDNAGLLSLRLLVDGRPDGAVATTCDFHRVAPCTRNVEGALVTDLRQVPDGRHEVTVISTDAASNVTRRSFPIRVDNTAPDRVSGLTSDPRGWTRKMAFGLSWTNPASGSGASTTSAYVQLCSDVCIEARRFAGADIGTATISVPAPGRWRARVWVGDEAGNSNPATAQEVELLADPTPPSLRMIERDETRPGLLEVAANDDLSGIATAEIEVRRVHDDAWFSLALTRTPRGFAGVVDDERLPAGRYLIRARAIDRARNERTLSGGSIDLPFRVASKLRVGKRKKVRMQGIGGRKFRKILVARPRVPFGLPTLLRGRLTTPGGNPLAERDVDIAERPLGADEAWIPVASVRTDSDGKFLFRALPGPTRHLRFRYGGTATIRGESRFVTLRVRAASTLHVSPRRVVNGEAVRFSGTVQGEVPSSGKLLKLQVFARGSWLTFATPRADRRGRWHHAYRFTATRGVTRYRFRVRLPREGGFPYVPGTSRQVRVKVIGL